MTESHSIDEKHEEHEIGQELDRELQAIGQPDSQRGKGAGAAGAAPKD